VLAVELGVDGVRVNVICPGLIETELGEEGNNAGAAAAMARTPSKRLGKPEDLQGIVVYLASDMSRYHTGDTITLDGGMMAQCF